MKTKMLTLLIATFMSHAYADASLDGVYKLDFDASPGACVDQIYLKYQDGSSVYEPYKTFEIRYAENQYPDEFNIGARCSDRRFPGDPLTPIENCTNSVETNTISDDRNVFEHRKDYYRRNSDGSTKIVPINRSTYEMISQDRLEINGRCRYDRIK